MSIRYFHIITYMCKIWIIELLGEVEKQVARSDQLEKNRRSLSFKVGPL
jgi:hypothetical protein